MSIVGAGHSLAIREVGNIELCQSLNVTPEWIEKKTGIKSRRIASKDETASSFALKASISALNDAGVGAGEIGLIIVATFPLITYFLLLLFVCSLILGFGVVMHSMFRLIALG